MGAKIKIGLKKTKDYAVETHKKIDTAVKDPNFKENVKASFENAKDKTVERAKITWEATKTAAHAAKEGAEVIWEVGKAGYKITKAIGVKMPRISL